MSTENRSFALAAAVVLGIIVVLFSVNVSPARDNGQWEGSDPEVRQWFKSLMQPDNPTSSCCGEADAYWCDDISVRNGKTYCRITDPRPDAPLGRPHREIGEEYEIPPEKLKWDSGNPTWHYIIFLRVDGFVWCFVQAGGV
jgi:hypothetical protein